MKGTKIEPCNCKSYSFPHRLGGGKCSSDMDCEDYEFDEYLTYDEREAARWGVCVSIIQTMGRNHEL